jgi:hypothetical protein
MNDNHIIKPPEIKTNDIPKRYYRYVIDSRDRNVGHFQDPSKYEIKLSEDIHDVQSVELLSFDVPFTKYLINSSNRTFYYKVGDDECNFSIDEGDYETVDDLVTELNNKKGSAPFTFSELLKQKKLKLTATANVTLVCLGDAIQKNNYPLLSPTYKSQLMKVLGLSLKNHVITVSSEENPVQYPFQHRVDLRKDKYMVMNLGQSSVNFSENNPTHKSFAIIKKDELDNKYIDANYKKFYNPPIPSMSTLRISFTDYSGQLYDFQNQDHMIELMFCCFKNQRKYNDIFHN